VMLWGVPFSYRLRWKSYNTSASIASTFSDVACLTSSSFKDAEFRIADCLEACMLYRHLHSFVRDVLTVYVESVRVNLDTGASSRRRRRLFT